MGSAMTALSELREQLHVSVSQLKCYLKCPEKYRLQYVVGAEPEFRPANLVIGSAVHEGLAAHYSAVMQTSKSPEMEVCMDAFQDSLTAARKGKIPIEDIGKDLEAIGIGLLKAFYDRVHENPPKVVGVEYPFSIELHDPVTGEALEEKLVGALDLVVEENGRKIIGEHKSAARRWPKDQIEHDLQLAGYKLVGQKLGMRDVGLRLQILTKTKVPTLVVEDTDRDEKAIQEFLATTVGVLKAVDAGVFFPIRTTMCTGCPFQRQCEGR